MSPLRNWFKSVRPGRQWIHLFANAKAAHVHKDSHRKDELLDVNFDANIGPQIVIDQIEKEWKKGVTEMCCFVFFGIFIRSI